MFLCTAVQYGGMCAARWADAEGLTVCYDLRFAELYGHLAWECECDLILHLSAFIRNATFGSYHPFATTHAVENGVYLLSVNYRYAGERLWRVDCLSAVARASSGSGGRGHAAHSIWDGGGCAAARR